MAWRLTGDRPLDGPMLTKIYGTTNVSLTRPHWVEPKAHLGCMCPICLQEPATLQWRHYEHEGVSTHRRIDRLLSRLFRRRSKETSKQSVTGLCTENSPVAGVFPSQRASNAENVFISWHHHELVLAKTQFMTRALCPMHNFTSSLQAYNHGRKIREWRRWRLHGRKMLYLRCKIKGIRNILEIESAKTTSMENASTGVFGKKK